MRTDPTRIPLDRLAIASGLALALLFVASLAHAALGSAAGEEAPAFVPGELIVKMRAAAPQRATARAEQGAPGLTLRDRLEALRVRFGARAVRETIRLHDSVRMSATARRTLDLRSARRARGRGRQARGRRLERVEARLEELSRFFVLEVAEDADLGTLAARLNADPEVEYAHPNYVAHALFTPDDPFFSTCCSWGQTEDDLWGLKLLELEAAWGNDPTDFENAGEGVVVAVVDSGLDLTHPDIAANLWVNTGHGASPPEIAGNGIDDDGNGYIDDVNGFDFVGSFDANGDGDYDDPEDVVDSDPTDEYGHGTHVTGTIAAVGNNAQGIVGVAPKAQIMVVRGLDASGAGTFENLAAALVYAAVNGADVINNSWGCGFCPSSGIIEEAVRLAHDMDAVVVFAAGNASDNATRRSPQNMSETITVSALTPGDALTGFSSFGPLVDVGAPGGGLASGPAQDPIFNVLSLNAQGSFFGLTLPHLVVAPGYLRLAGTSMAAPHASGVAALLRGFDATLGNEQIRQILRLASDPITATGPFAGYGRVNGRKVLESTIQTELLIETPVERAVEGGVTLEGFARGPNLQNVQVLIGEGEAPAIFDPLPTTYDPVTGDVSASFDTSQALDGLAVVRLQADDGVRSYESSTTLVVDNLRFVEPVASSTVSGAIDVVLNVGTSPFLQRVVISYFNDFSGATETLLDTTSFPSAQLTTTLDTLASLDSDQLLQLTPTLTATATYLVDGETIERTEAVGFQIDNDRIDSPALGTRFDTAAVFPVVGAALHDVRLEARLGASWVPVGASAPGSFSIPVDVVGLGADLDLDNRVALRLLADIDGDGQYEAGEQNALSIVLIDSTLGPAWPQLVAGGAASLGLGVALGDVDGDGSDEAVVTLDGTPFFGCTEFVGFSCVGELVPFDPPGGVYAYEGDGSLNAAVLSGSAAFQEPACSNQAALRDLDGRQGLEMVWASFGQIGALRHDGQAPAGFLPDAFNAGLFDILAHQDPSYREIFPCRPVTAFEGTAGERRLIQQTRLFDWSDPAGGSLGQLAENRIFAFDETGRLANERDKGPGRSHNVNWAVVDVDVDGSPEIVTIRPGVGIGPEVTTTVLIYDAVSLALESEFDVDDAYDPLTESLMVGNVGGGPELEIVFFAWSHTPGIIRTLYVVEPDGTSLTAGPLVLPNGTWRALADLDGDGDVEILGATGFSNDVMLRALDYDPASQQLSDLPGWPVALPRAARAVQIETILVGNIDGDPEPEVLYSSEDQATLTVGGQVASVGPLLSSVSALEADGSPWRGGWSRTVPGLVSMALGDLDAGPEADLVLVSRDVLQSDPRLPGYRRGEVRAYALQGSFDVSTMQWSHRYGNAQQTGSIADSDQDGWPDRVDNCTEVANGSQCNGDGDRYGNHCDGDLDQNGIVDAADVNLFLAEFGLPGASSGADMDCNGVVDADDIPLFQAQLAAGVPGPSGVSADQDGDEVLDGSDNCIAVANPTQCNGDGDAHGNHCDGDFDQNGSVDAADVNLFLADFGLPGSSGTDMDCNGVVDSGDIPLFQAQLDAGSPGP